MKFLGTCEICGRVVRTYRSLSMHLRMNPDSEHTALKRRYLEWKNSYRSTLRCRKCGSLWKNYVKADRNKKNCPKCCELRKVLGRRKYEEFRPEMKPDPRQVMPGGSKASWDGVTERRVTWTPHDTLYTAIVDSVRVGDSLDLLTDSLGVPRTVAIAICEHAFGVDGWATMIRQKKARVGVENFQTMWAQYKAMTPEEKVVRARAWSKKPSKLELLFSSQMKILGIMDFKTGQWQSIPIDGVFAPRQADMKVSVGDGRKVVVLCDGEAFHGPKCFYTDPKEKVREDRKTALAYFELGYSVVRYSETEIQSGWAVEHLKQLLKRLTVCQGIYRNWYPDEEQVR